MSRSYPFEADIAQKTDIAARYIEKPGIYTGKFSAAWYEQSRSGAECIKFRFVADNGSQANNLAIYTHNGRGEPLPGYRLIQKIMACMKVKNLNARPDKVELFDYHSKQMIKQARDVYPMLYGPIGLVLTTEDYETKWETKKQVIIHAVFEPQSRLMSDEILNGITEPAALDKLIVHLDAKNEWHKTPKTLHSAPKPNANQTAIPTPTNHSFEEDPVPF